MGLSREDIIAVIQALTARGFYKSMTSYADYRVWQDVYRVRWRALDLYLKFTVKPDGGYLLMSFKEK